MKRNLGQLTAAGVPLIVNGIHKFWPDRCTGVSTSCCVAVTSTSSLVLHADTSSPCVQCNDFGKEELFREVLEEVTACAAAANSNVQMLSTLGMTFSFQAMKDGHDAVHYGHNTSAMEAQVLLNVICNDMVGDVPESREGCGAAVHHQYDRRLTELNGETAKSRCLPKDFKPKHK